MRRKKGISEGAKWAGLITAIGMAVILIPKYFGWVDCNTARNYITYYEMCIGKEDCNAKLLYRDHRTYTTATRYYWLQCKE